MEDKKVVLLYDIKNCPEGLNLENIYNIMVNSGIVVYDSTFGGNMPKVIDNEELVVMDVKFISTKEIADKFSNIS
jgi:hypothetical protein